MVYPAACVGPIVGLTIVVGVANFRSITKDGALAGLGDYLAASITIEVGDGKVRAVS